MSPKPNFPVRNAVATSLLFPPLCLLLSACGGDGTTFVSSLPPPPATPTPAPTLAAGTTTYAYPSSSAIDVQTT